MSQWTHVNGSIRLEGMIPFTQPASKEIVIAEIKEHFGSMALWEDSEEAWDKCTVPKGSEGSLQYFINCTGESGSSNTGPKGEFETADYRWVVTIIGDLRRYDSAEEIIEWVKKSTKDLWVREAVIRISIEGLRYVILTYDHSNNWQVEERAYAGD